MIYYDLGTEARRFLIDEGIVRKPNVSGSEPTCFVNPVYGSPEPGAKVEGSLVGDTTVTIYQRSGPGSRPLEEFVDASILEVVVRANDAIVATETANAIKAALADRRHFMMGQLVVEQALRFRNFGFVPLGDGASSHMMVGSWLVEVRDESLVKT